MSCDRTLIAQVAYQLLHGKVSSGVGCTSVKYPVLTADVSPQADSKNRVFADTVTLVDGFALSLHRSLADSVTLTDAIDLRTDWRRLFADTVALTDALTLTTQWGRAYADTVSVSDALVKEVDKPLDEAIVVTDAVVKKLTKRFADTLTMTDAFSTGKNQSLSDAAALTDTGVLLNQGYFDHTGNPQGYFADDYFGVKRTW